MGGRRTRRAVIIAAALLAVLAGAVTFGPALLNLERYRGQIARQISRAVGREVTVGAIRASFWRLGAEVRGIRVAERAGYGTLPFLEGEKLRVRVALFPLLRGNFRVGSAVLERPRIHLARGRDGRWNVEDLWPAPGAAPPGSQPAGRSGAESPRPPRAASAALVVGDLRVRGGELRIDDARAGVGRGASLALRDLRLDIRQTAPQDPIAVELTGDVAGGGTLAAAGRVAAQAQGVAVEGRLSLRGFDVSALAPYLPDPGTAGAADLLLTAKGTLPAIEFSGELDLARTRLDLGVLAPKGPGEEAHLSLAGRATGEGVDLSKVGLRWRGMTADGRVLVRRFKPLEATFTLQADRLDLDRLLAMPGEARGGVGAERQGRAGAGIRGSGSAGVAWGAERVPPPRRGPAAPGGPPGGGPPGRAEGTVRAAAVRWHGLELQNAQARVTYRDGLLEIRELSGGLAGGRLVAAGTLDLRGRHPALALRFKLEEAQLQPLVAAAGPAPVRAQGILTADGSLSAPAVLPGSTMGSLAGAGSLVIRDGRVAGYAPLDRLAEMLGSAPAGVKLLKARLDEFQRLSGTFTLDKGFLRTRDLTLTRADGQATAAGSLNLLDQALDFDVVLRVGRATLEAKVLGTPGEPLVVPTLARLDRRVEMEIDRTLKGRRGKKIQELLRDLLR